MNTHYEEDFNKALGFKLMTLRQSHKMSQEYLGARLGVRYQQIQKYEAGQTRMPPERIAICAKMLEVPIEYFFGTDGESKQPQYNKAVLTVAAEIMSLPNDDVRKGFYHLVRIINKLGDEEGEEFAVKQQVSA